MYIIGKTIIINNNVHMFWIIKIYIYNYLLTKYIFCISYKYYI